jgi:hypothetical protein
MSDEAQTIVGVVALLAVLLFFLTPFLLFFIYVFYQTGKRKRIRERILRTQQQLIAGRACIPARYASEARFKAWFKIFPWEAGGVLIPAPGNLMFLGEMLSGGSLNLQFASGRSEIRWLGKCPWPNGAVSWFACDASGEKHFFTSETGAFIIGSNRSTKAAYDEARKGLADSVLRNL